MLSGDMKIILNQMMTVGRCSQVIPVSRVQGTGSLEKKTSIVRDPRQIGNPIRGYVDAVFFEFLKHCMHIGLVHA